MKITEGRTQFGTFVTTSENVKMKLMESKRKPSYLPSVLQCKCARCREGNMFEHGLQPLPSAKNMQMPTHCKMCGQPMEIEVGFYYGTGYVSYALTVAISVAVFVAYWVLIGISIKDNSLFYYLGINALILLVSMPYTMRLSRSIWLSFFVKYDADWRHKAPEKVERIVEGQMGNW